MSHDIATAATGNTEGVLTLTAMSGTINGPGLAGAGNVAVVPQLRLTERDTSKGRSKVGGTGFLVISDRLAGEQPFAVAEQIPVHVLVEEILPSPLWGGAVARLTITSREPGAQGASSSALLGIATVPELRKKIPAEPVPVLYSGAGKAPWFVWNRKDVAQYTVSVFGAQNIN